MTLLELQNISKTYVRGGMFWSSERVEAVAKVSFTIDEGMCMGLAGQSGSGKSTLGRIILGLERPDSGAIAFMGYDILDKKGLKAVRRELQVVFQNCFDSVNPRFTASQIIGEPLRNFEKLTRARGRMRAVELLEAVGLSEKDAAKHPHQFSGGELQRVCIARAIAPNPRLIVLDEALGSLDMIIRARILETLSELRQRLQTAYLFISHDIRLIRHICDRMAVMDNGRIVDTTDNMENLESLSHPASKKLFSSILPGRPRHESLVHSQRNHRENSSHQ